MTEINFDIIWKIATIVFGAGAIWNELKAIRKDLNRLEQKQDKYNHLQERVARLEAKQYLKEEDYNANH